MRGGGGSYQGSSSSKEVSLQPPAGAWGSERSWEEGVSWLAGGRGEDGKAGVVRWCGSHGGTEV